MGVFVGKLRPKNDVASDIYHVNDVSAPHRAGIEEFQFLTGELIRARTCTYVRT